MINRLSNILRSVIMLIGGTIIVFKIIDDAREKHEKIVDNVLEKEFDDIW